MAKKNYSHGTPEQMLAAFESKLQELGGDVSACSNVTAAASYIDVSGMFGEPGATITDVEMRDYWEREHLNDPTLSQYGEDGFEDWYRGTKEWLRPVRAESYTQVETDAEYTSRFIHTLVGDVNAALEANSELDSWTWEEQEKDLVLTTIAGDSINEYSIPKSDLTLDWDRISEDVDYILNEVQSFEDEEVFEDPQQLDAVESSEELIQPIGDADVISWLSEHEQAFEDACDYFNSADLSDVEIDDIIDWISEHDTLYGDFVARFPAFGGDVSSATDINSSEIIEGSSHWDDLACQLIDELNAVNIALDDKAEVINELVNNFGYTEEEAEGLFVRINECAADLSQQAVTSSEIEVPAEQYTFIKSKQVEDADGFMTDYTMYYDTVNDGYVFVFGDNEVYKPEDGDFDYECETEEEANEWFDSYTGFAEDEDEFDDPEDEYGEW